MTQANAKPKIIHCSLMKLTTFQNFALFPSGNILAFPGVAADVDGGAMFSASLHARLGFIDGSKL